jgi:hypothetical protein
MGHPTYLSTIFYNLLTYLPTYNLPAYLLAYLPSTTYLLIIGEPFEPLIDEWEAEMNEGETSTKQQIHVLNETLINFFKGYNGKELAQLAIPSSSSVCQLCNMMGHNASSCWKLSEKPKCGKCEGGMTHSQVPC